MSSFVIPKRTPTKRAPRAPAKNPVDPLLSEDESPDEEQREVEEFLREDGRKRQLGFSESSEDELLVNVEIPHYLFAASVVVICDNIEVER